jgi:alpha,alpha-trehalase
MGNHGLEVLGGPPPPIRSAAKRLQRQIGEVVAEIRTRLAGVPGLAIEHKDLSASVHYRLVDAADAVRIRRVVTAVVEQHRPWVKLTEGKLVLELRPNLPWDKGRAVLWWLEQRYGRQWPDRVLPVYFGDDRTDEDAFGALAGHGITVAVAPAGPTAAAYYVRGPAEVLEFLRALPHRPRGPTGAPTQTVPIS